jgi:2-keto-4-pentenoate hydratase/2-oxohepta-3-ene-1,7-dioic acid hydratase in catechol pathway
MIISFTKGLFVKLLHFSTPDNAAVRLGIITDKGIVEARTTLVDLMQKGIESLESSIASATKFINPDTITYHPAITPPEKIICIGLNYRRHAQESGMAEPSSPILFSKFNNSLAAHNQDVPLPSNAVQYDYETELGVVIGKEARYVSKEDALNYVFGYCTANDLSVRDLQMRTSQWLLGKTLDRFMPIGPYLVTADEVPDPQAITLSCWVNGERRQHSTTADMIFNVAEIVTYISQYMTLKPGDFISTGTPEGVVLGMKEKQWLKLGDVVTVEVEGLGALTNKMIAE